MKVKGIAMDKFTDKIDSYRGLTSDEVAERTSMYGYNGESRQLDTAGDFKPARILFSYRFLIMFLAAAAIIISGLTSENPERGIGGGFVMLLLAFIYSAVEIYKGYKCRDSFKELRRVSSPRFRVLRDSGIVLLRREFIVPDDIIILQEGESVPADAHLLEAAGVSADESLFTGDSTPAAKRIGADSKNEIKQTCIYKGTRLLSGSAIARVTATGIDTKKCREFGEVEPSATYMTEIENAASKAMPMFWAASAVFLIMFFVITMLTKGAEMEIVEFPFVALLPAFAFALCLMPAEAPRLVRSHYLFGAFSLLRKNCVVKDLRAIESLSAITAVCVDKTGVITKSHTSLTDEHSADPETLARISVLSCKPASSSSLDRAIILGAAFKSVDVKALQENELICCYPFSEETKLGGNLWRINGSLLLCVKGSPEMILTKCDLTPDYLFSVQQKQQKYAELGHRVVAVAYVRITDENNLPQFAHELDYTFVGLYAFANQTRDSAPAAVRSCYKAGVKVIMTTGDSADAAVAIARKVGFNEPLAVTGDYLRECQLEGVAPDIKGVNIFARVTPDQKPYIIELLQNEGEIVAATGIGAADVKALEKSDVGVALPQETSGAAKEACGLVLADDDFNSVIDALKETRQIHYNIKQTIGNILIAVTAMVMFTLFCLFSGGGETLSPVAVSLPAVLLLPLLSLPFFGNRADIKSVMSASGFVGRGKLDLRFLLRTITQGLCVSLAVLVFRLLLWGESSDVLNACFLAAFAGGLIGAALVNLSASIPIYKLAAGKCTFALIIAGAVLLLVILLTYLPVVNTAFGLTAINPLRFISALLLGLISQSWVEIPKIRDYK
ncbi:MAG: cation-translocating P-type ATPase [Oscillospiraceae bacterium]|jgi:Ca2+-transporting ATPase|nr:cation-translocating P-type ATPase [Oscillospiraceae bacterium]